MYHKPLSLVESGLIEVRIGPPVIFHPLDDPLSFGSQELESYLHQLLVVVPEENLLSVGVDLQVDVDQIFPLTGW